MAVTSGGMLDFGHGDQGRDQPLDMTFACKEDVKVQALDASGGRDASAGSKSN